MALHPLVSKMDWATLAPESLELFRTLLRFDTTNPPGLEEACARHLASVLEGAGLAPQVLVAAPGRANVVCRLKGKGTRPPLLLGALRLLLRPPLLLLLLLLRSTLGRLLCGSWKLFGGFGWLLVGSGRLLDSSGRLLGGSWAAFGRLWLALGRHWAILGRLWLKGWLKSGKKGS